MTEPRTFTYTSPTGQVVVVTKVPTMTERDIDGAAGATLIVDPS